MTHPTQFSPITDVEEVKLFSCVLQLIGCCRVQMDCLVFLVNRQKFGNQTVAGLSARRGAGPILSGKNELWVMGQSLFRRESPILNYGVTRYLPFASLG